MWSMLKAGLACIATVTILWWTWMILFDKKVSQKVCTLKHMTCVVFPRWLQPAPFAHSTFRWSAHIMQL